MGKRCSVVVIAFLFLTVLASCLLVPTCNAESATLIVEVRHQLSREPIAGATVSISGPGTYSGVTGSDGKVAFSSIPAGDYAIVVSVAKYPNTAPQTVYVSGTTTTMVLFAYTKAYFVYTPRQPNVNDTVAFNASRSESSANITGYSWDFGDGSPLESGMTPTHTFTKSGTYTVVLTVTSEVGTATYNQIVQVITPGEAVIFPWILLLLPFLLIPLIIFWRRRRYYVVIQVRVPSYAKQPHCPGNNTIPICEECKMGPC